jgi:gas vesicle protein
MKNSKTVIGILGGVAVGAALGILFAPDKGSNTRKKITKKSTDTADELKEKLNSLANSFSEKYSSLVNKGEALVEKTADEISFENIKKINKFK